MNTPLNIHVSAFASATNTTPHPVRLIDWLRSTIEPRTPAELKRVERIMQIRNHPEINDLDSKTILSLKKQLPGITPGAMCKGGRIAGTVKQKTGFVQIDIDLKDNPGLPTGAALREAVSHIRNVFFAGLSTRGAGVWGLVKVADPNKQKEHFEQLKKDFARFGIVLDGKGKNPHDLRFYSFDPDAYLNPAAIIYNRLPEPDTEPEPEPIVISQQRTSSAFTTETDVLKIVQQIQQQRTDITGKYDNWAAIGFGFATLFGKEGRRHFHAVSQYHDRYDREETDQLYDNCVNSSIIGSIKPFFHYAKQAGIFFMPPREKRHPHSPRNERTQEKAGTDTPEYPLDWDDIQLIPDSTEYGEATRQALSDMEPGEVQDLMRVLFDTEIVEETI